MLEFLLLIILLLVGMALYRGWRVYSAMRRFMRDPVEEMRRQAQARNGGATTGQRQQRRSTGNPFMDMFFGAGAAGAAPGAVRKKRIPRDVGEYVHFTETRTTVQGAPRAPYRVEQQIEDIEWEDIK